MLEEEGCKVQWEQPREERDASGMVEAVVTQLVASGLLAGIQAAITRFRERTKGRGEVTDGDDDD
jgi:hypothetical protein